MSGNEEKAGKKMIFRQKSLERISSPEALNDYLKVTNPGTWMIMGAVIVMLLGIIVWSFLGNLETTVAGDATAEKGHITAFVIEDGAKYIHEGQTIYIGDKSSLVGEVTTDEFGRMKVEASMDIPDGEYRAKIVIEKVTPFNLLFD